MTETTSPPSSSAPQGVQLAPQHLRLLALLLDYLAAMIVVKLFDLLQQGQQWDLDPQKAWPWPVSVGLTLLLLVFRDSLGGASLGKRISGICVRAAADPSHTPPMGHLLLRNMTLVLFPVEMVLVFTDGYCRRLGDRLGKTVVVLPEKPADLSRRLLVLSIAFLGLMLVVLLVNQWHYNHSAVFTQANQILMAQDLKPWIQGQPNFVATDQTDLSRLETGGPVTFQFEADGQQGKVLVTIRLQLDTAAHAWKVLEVTTGLVPKTKTVPQQPAPPQTQEAAAPPKASS